MRNAIKNLANFVLFIVFITQITACKKKDPDSELSKPLETWSNTLIAKVPSNAFSIVYWDTNKAAYEKYLASSWGAGNSRTINENLAVNNPFVNPFLIKDFLDTIKKSGYSIDETAWDEIFSENVLFATTEETENGSNLYFGLLIKSKDRKGLYKFIDALKQTATEQGSLKAISSQSKNIDSFGIELSDAENKSTTKTLYFSRKDDLAVIASSSKNLEAILNSTSSDLPTMLRSPEYKRAVKGFPTSKNIFSLTYFDLNVLRENLPTTIPSSWAAKVSKVPFSTFVMTTSMDKELSYNMRLLSNEEHETTQFIASNIAQSSVEKTLKSADANALAMLSVDGVTAKSIIGNINVVSGLVGENIDKVFADLKRVSIIGKIGMPLPDIMIVVESSSAEKESELLKRMISSVISAGGNSSVWQRTTSDKNPIDYINSPMPGMKIYVATADNLTFISTSENMIKSAIFSSEGSKDFTAQLPKSTRAAYAKDKSVVNLYIDFAEVASFMERIGGAVGMYIPNEPRLKEFLEPKGIERIRQSGALVASVTVDEDHSFRIRAAYAKKKR